MLDWFQNKFKAGSLGVVVGAFLMTAPLIAFADAPALFVKDGALVRAESGLLKAVTVKHKGPVHEYLGALPGGRALVSLGSPYVLDSMIADTGVEIAILSPTGEVEQSIMKDAVRAWASPSGRRIAVIDLNYSIHLFENGALLPLEIPERVVLAAWPPDESRLCLTAYPPDWSPHRSHNPDSVEEFLRLINSDLHLYDLTTSSSRQLTDAPGYDYSAVWQPDGGSVMFISSRDGTGAFFLLNIATGNFSKITNITPGSYDIPVGRSDSFVWSPKTNEWLYSAQEADTRENSIRALSQDGTASRILGYGRHVRLADEGRAAIFLDADGQPQRVELQPAGGEDAR